MSETSEILKSGPIDKVADLLHKLAGPMTEEFGAMLGDKVRVYRVKNMIETMRKTDRILRSAGLPPNSVPPRLLLPIVENSSVEDNETLQEMWAGLLATASQEKDSVSPSFIETLKQLTPDEARHLEHICSRTPPIWRSPSISAGLTLPPWAFCGSSPPPALFPELRSDLPNDWTPPQSSSDTFERLGLIRREYEVMTETSTNGGVVDEVFSQMDYQFVFTGYGVRFLQACRGPGSQSQVD